MADDTKSKNAQVRERTENPETPRKLQQENSIREERRVGSWLFRAVAPLVAGLAFGCGSPSSYEEDVDADVEQDISDVTDRAEDADRVEDTLDAHDVEEVVEDAPLEVEEDAGPDEDGAPEFVDAEDTPDISEDAGPEAEDVAEIEAEIPDGEEAEADTYDCTESTRTEETPTVLPDPVCGCTQTLSDVDYVREWVGADCESTGTTRTRIGKTLILTPDLDAASLGCARCRTTSTLNGDEVLVTVTTTGIETAYEIICADMTVGTNLDGGATEDKFRLTDVRADQAVGTLFDQDWRLLRNVRVYPTGAPTSIDPSRGLIGADLNAGAATARICIIELPTMTRNNGDTETWTGYPGIFTFHTNVSGASMQGWGWSL